jgi:polyferredoxin
VLVYSGMLMTIAVALVVAVLLRVPLRLDVIRDRNSLFREASQGRIENVYVLKLMNMDSEPHRYRITATGIEGLALRADDELITVRSGEVTEVPVALLAERYRITKRSTPIRFHAEAEDNPKLKVEEDARFLGPVD